METVAVTLLREGDGMQQLLKAIGFGGACLAVLVILSALALIKLASLAAAFWFDTRFPELSDAVLRAYQGRTARCYLVGVVNLVLGVLLALVLLNIPILALFGLVLLLVLYALGFIAYVATYRHLGSAIPLSPSWDTRGGALLAGALMAEGAFLIPLLGQIVSIASLLRGFGAVMLALIARRQSNGETGVGPAPTDESATGA